jgi:hypothetical protein
LDLLLKPIYTVQILTAYFIFDITTIVSQASQVVSSRERRTLMPLSIEVLRILSCEQINIYTILGSHTGDYEEFCLLGYNAVEYVEKSTDISEEYFASISIL